MRLHLRHVGPTSASLEIENGHAGRSEWEHEIFLDGHAVQRCDRNVFTLHGLRPATEYAIRVLSAEARIDMIIRTRPASHIVDVREFGARGNGVDDDTAAIQAAIASCPPESVIDIPAGHWLTGPLFLKSRVHLHLAKDARLIGHVDVDRWPLLPASLPSLDNVSSTELGSWEGVPESMHAGLLTGIDVHDVHITGEGCIDANASFATWWSRPKGIFRGRRPRALYLVGCSDIAVTGLTFCNSPSWSLHARNSRLLRFVDVEVLAPEHSPNTDGINPESCEDVLISGARIAVGDDCIAIKSGKRTERDEPARPTRGVTISNCVLRHGHAAVALGSEMSGGVYDVDIRDCLFVGTERGLRIKTRRGRGRKGIVAGVAMSNVRMENVGTPFAVNCFYDCDLPPDATYERDRTPMPVDEGTPRIAGISLRNVRCENAQHSAAYVLGLPEAPVEDLSIQGYRVTMDPQATPGRPDKARGIEAIARSGVYVANARNVRMENVEIEGAIGSQVTLENTELVKL